MPSFISLSGAFDMIHRIEIALKAHLRDAYGEKIKKRIIRDLGFRVNSVKTVDVYTIDADIDEILVNEITEGLFVDPIVQEFTVNRAMARDFDWLIEVGYLPGVTDNVGKTARETVELFLDRPLGESHGIYTSKQYLIQGNLNREDIYGITRNLLANSLIERFDIRDRSSWDAGNRIGPRVSKVIDKTDPKISRNSLELSDEALVSLSQAGVLALDLKEMRAIKEYLRKEEVIAQRKQVGLDQSITDVEIEALAQTWSEHCKHKIFNGVIQYSDEKGKDLVIDGLFNTYIRGATEAIRKSLGKRDWCLSVFKDNAGVIEFNDEWSLVFKVETHNTPSALEPYGGALTGIVGVNRDPVGTGKGAKLFFNVDTFCFASPFYNKPLPGPLLHPRRIFEGVREGVEHGGNKSGIPTVNGAIVFDDRYVGKPLVYCGTGGIMPRTISGKPSHIKAARPGDFIVMTGGRIGKDGIHGATFSSEELHESSPVTAVQIGDPITQKKMTDFLLRARDMDLYNTITDNGAGGLSSSVGEMARDCNGCELHLEKAPLKYQGLDPWEILISEAQERMTLAVSPEKISSFLSLAKKMDVEATILGNFTSSGKFHCLYEGKTVAYLAMDFLHEGVPRMEMTARWSPPTHEEPFFEEPKELSETLLNCLSRLNVCSKEVVIRQYDHEVQGGSVIKPLVGVDNDGPSDGAVLRPILDTYEGVVISNGICPKFSDIDTYHMMACAIDEAIRNNVAVGGRPDRIAGLDNFCWPDPIQSEKTLDGHYKLAQLVRANMALYDYTVAFGVPCISGKDSMKNDYMVGTLKISIPPTVLFSVIGKIDDCRKAVTMDVKRPGDLVYVLGTTFRELGGSEYFGHNGWIGNDVPHVEAAGARTLYERLHEAITKGLVASVHDCSDGGLGVALAESAFAGDLGMEIDIRKVPAQDCRRNDFLLFSESQSRFVVTVNPEYRNLFEELLSGLPFGWVGAVMQKKRLRVIGLDGKTVIECAIDKLKKAWKNPLSSF